ncbi:MAG: hypothetical protein Fur0020_12590 [Thermodesulfovibrionia bacterium]
MTVKDQNGKVLFSKTKDYEVYDLHLPQNKKGWLGFDDWDITAMTHVNLGLEPLSEDSERFVAVLNKDTTVAEIEAAFVFHYEEGNSAVIDKVSRRLEFK